MRLGEETGRDLECQIVRCLRGKKALSRVELARRMELAPSTIGAYVDRLISHGYLQEGRKLSQGTGRPATAIGLNPLAGCFAGIDFEGRHFWVTAVDFAQQVLHSKRVPIQPSETAEAILEKAEIAIASTIGGDRKLLGLAIGVPGLIDMEKGVAVHYSHIRGWSDLPLKQRFEARFKVPVSLENNIRAMALAEELFGQGQGVRNFICVGVRSGIAAGIVIDNQLYTGANHLAGEIGNYPCPQGATLEQRASLLAVLETLEEAIRNGEPTKLSLRRDRLHLQDLLVAARAQDPLVQDVFWNTGKVLGRVLAQITFVLNPEKIIVSGPLAEFESTFIRSIREEMDTLLLPPHSKMPEVVGSTLGEYSGALGAAALAVREWVPGSREN
ncbi:ROK family protein [Planctomicrobium sp. SH661]|uniref:ROK family protein n=1 Tax=Planctomicrobium sp. SH661 TaxID=3448124 RepID=UPI003F5B2CE8